MKKLLIAMLLLTAAYAPTARAGGGWGWGLGAGILGGAIVGSAIAHHHDRDVVYIHDAPDYNDQAIEEVVD